MNTNIFTIKLRVAGIPMPAARAILWFESKPRPAQLLMVVCAVCAVGLLLDAATGWQVWDQLFYPTTSDVAKVRFWSALVYNLVLAMGLPVAFLVWHWRDKNARDQIEQQRLQVENARKDTNLKEFQEVQGRAAGLFDEKLPARAQEQLQIAALHQLRGFLRGEYGESFRRPAFELLLAGHAESMDRIGLPMIRDQIEGSKKPSDTYEINQVKRLISKKLDRVMRERIGIIRDESNFFVKSGFPLRSRIWDFCDFSGVDFPDDVDLRGSSFLFSIFEDANLEGAMISGGHFAGADLNYAILRSAKSLDTHFEGAILSRCDFENADLRWSHFEGAQLSDSNLKGANLGRANFDNAELDDAHLEGADLNRASLSGTLLDGAWFDDHTRLTIRIFNKISKDIDSLQTEFRNLGARHINDQIETVDSES